MSHVPALIGTLLVAAAGCAGMSRKGKGGLIGAGSGAVIGGIIGKQAGNTALGAILTLFSRRFRYGLIANSAPYRFPVADTGSNPVTDPLLSARSFEIVDDGGEVFRREKVGAIVNWPEAMADLRVCNARASGDRNCCVCEKCIRTIITLRLYRDTLPGCFSQDVTDAQIRRLDLRYDVLALAMERIRAEAQARGMGAASWVRALRWPIRRCQWRLFRKRLTAGLS